MTKGVFAICLPDLDLAGKFTYRVSETFLCWYLQGSVVDWGPAPLQDFPGTLVLGGDAETSGLSWTEQLPLSQEAAVDDYAELLLTRSLVWNLSSDKSWMFFFF